MRFTFVFDRPYALAARPFGITPAGAWVDVEEGQFAAHYGRWSVRTPVTNIARATITGPYLFVKTAGSPRLGVTDRGLSFTSNGRCGVELHFHEKVRGLPLLRHPNLTVTVADCEGLVRALDL